MNLVYKEVILNQIQLLFPGMPFFKCNRDHWEKKNKQYLDCIRIIENSDSVKAIPLEKVKQAREKIKNSSIEVYTDYEEYDMVETSDALKILDELIKESEG